MKNDRFIATALASGRAKGAKNSVRAARNFRRLSREELARKCDITVDTVARIENGMVPGPVLLKNLGAALSFPGELLLK